MPDPRDRRLQPVPGQIVEPRRMIRHLIGVILLLPAAFLAPLAEFLKRFIGAYIVDIVITYSGHSKNHSL